MVDHGGSRTVLNGPVYHTTERGEAPTLNPDGKIHVVSGFTDEYDDTSLRIGFEDLPHTGDADYNDVVFDLVYTPTYLNAGADGGDNILYGGDGADTFKYMMVFLMAYCFLLWH